MAPALLASARFSRLVGWRRRRDLTSLPESLRALEQHLVSSLERVRALEPVD